MIKPAMVQLRSRVRPVKREIPSTALRAGSSLSLKNGFAQDAKVMLRTDCTTTNELKEGRKLRGERRNELEPKAEAIAGPHDGG